MKMIIRFPGGLSKALTLSYDDGVVFDRRLIEIMKKNGIKGAFNINAGCFPSYENTKSRRLHEDEVVDLYESNGMEVAVHSYSHSFLEHIPDGHMTYEILKDKLELEKLFGKIIRGGAYAYGNCGERSVEALRLCGIDYLRTTTSTGKFSLPSEPLLLNPTCKHKDPKLFEYLADFLKPITSPHQAPKLFYVWGHSYEFEDDGNWDLIEKFCEEAGGHDDVWYATNIEIIDYLNAYKRLRLSADGTICYNPTSTEICFFAHGKIFTVKPGETIKVEKDTD